jgi:hypothetical protein
MRGTTIEHHLTPFVTLIKYLFPKKYEFKLVHNHPLPQKKKKKRKKKKLSPLIG